MADSPATRKAAERTRMRALGFVIFTAWVHKTDRERLARFAARLRRKWK